ncbi:MAG: S8 family serine peptidase [Cellulomonas sp.]|nr:S8 family serine peptidase [Cellulomonas sp.]
MNRRLLASVTAALVAASTALVGTGPAWAADSPPGADALASSPTSFDGTKVAPELESATGTVTAFVTLTTATAADVAADGGSSAQVEKAQDATEAAAADVVPTELTDANADTATPKRVATTVNVVAGTLVTGDAEQIRALASNPQVAGIYRVTPKSIDNSSTVAFTNALATWVDTGVLGTGVRIGVIDTGLDYTHADFGGPGTEAAYAQAYGTDGTDPIDVSLTDTAKFAGGYDFAGPTYDADDATSVPAPDANPIDSPYTSSNSGHGSHVAGTAAGYGVQADGTTFRGDYSTLSDLEGWMVGPGSAPGATLYGLKVFGDAGGTTNLVLPALDWAADPNGDGDLSDHLDVINLSLGSDYSPADDPENLAIDGLSDLGVTVVTSAGNGGDLEDVAGSPGNAASTIAVANSVGSPQPYAGVEVTAATDPALVTTWAAQNSVAYVSPQPDVTAPVAYVDPLFDGCSGFTDEQKAAVAGKVVWLWWDSDDSTRLCGSKARSDAAAAAGAVGALFTNNTTVFGSGITGSTLIPVAQLTDASTKALETEAAAGTLTVHIGPSLEGTVLDSSTPDVVSPSSSRGVHGSLGWSKPDVAAPGTNIVSVASSTGNGAQSLTGTSMASPHVAGIAALVRQAHPDWTPAQVKAAIVNTATHDLYTGANRTGEVYGPARVGSGRVDALAAVQDTVLAYNTDDPEQTSVSFGVVPVGDSTVTLDKTVTVTNLGTSDQTYATSFSTSTTAGGATITASPAQITVPAGGSAQVTLTLTADPATLARDIDPTQAVTQSGLDREYVTRLTGRLVLTSGDTELRVPVQAVPRATSALTSSALTFADAAAATADLQVSGRSLDTTNNLYSFATPLVLAATSPALDAVDPAVTSPSAVASADLRYVGWGTTAPAAAAAGDDPTTGALNVGIAVNGEWANLGAASTPVVDIDVDGDGSYDYETYVQKVSGADLTIAWTVSLSDGSTVAANFVNEFTGTVDNGAYDNSVVVLPIPLDIIPEGSTPTLSVWTYSIYAPAGASGVVDEVAPFTVDPYDPPLWFDSNVGRQTTLVDGATTITAHKGTGAADAQVLVLYPQNDTPESRVQLVDVTVPAPTVTTTTLKVTGGTKAGQQQTLTATVKPKAATGTVAFLDGTTQVATATVTNGTAKATTTLSGGTHSLTAVFTPDSGLYAGSTSAAVTVKVSASKTSTSLSLSPSKVTVGKPVTAKVTVRSDTAPVAGATVEVVEGGKVVATGTLTGTGLTGSASIALPTTLTAGKHTFTARLVGTADLAASTSAKATVTVTKARPAFDLTTPSWHLPRGSAPTFTATVSGPSGAPTPTGSVVVLVNFQPLHSFQLVAGTGSVTAPSLRFSAVVLAVYSGDASYEPSVSGGFISVTR